MSESCSTTNEPLPFRTPNGRFEIFGDLNHLGETAGYIWGPEVQFTLIYVHDIIVRLPIYLCIYSFQSKPVNFTQGIS